MSTDAMKHEQEMVPAGSREVPCCSVVQCRTISDSARSSQHGEVSIGEEIDILSFDGQRKTMLHSAVPIRDEGSVIIGGVVAILDITERKRLEKALVERISQLEAILEAMADGIFVYDSQGRIVQMNAAASELLFPGADIDFAAYSLKERLALLQVRDVQGQPFPCKTGQSSAFCRGKCSESETRWMSCCARWMGENCR